MSRNTGQPMHGNNELLRTKLAAPRLRSAHIARSDLLARLNQGLKYKLILLSAPAGFGKTTLVSEWMAYHERRDSPFEFAWLSLDEGDNDPFRFWQYIIAAVQTFSDIGLGKKAHALLHSGERAVYEKLLTALINDFMELLDGTSTDDARVYAHKFVVLEDYHLINSQQIHESITFLLGNLPDNLHLVLITRQDPPLPLARLYARDEILEIRTVDLRFSPPEIAAFFQQNPPHAIPSQALELLEQYTEGWPAGLQLANLALQRSQPRSFEHFHDALSAGRQQMIDYFVAEVLTQQSSFMQEFLLATTLFDRVTASLCNALLGRTDSASILADLEHANLFLIPLGKKGAEQTSLEPESASGVSTLVQREIWYRYHHLFAEAMSQVARRRLGESAIRAWYERASQWYEEVGNIPDAVEFALAAHAHARAAVLIERLTVSGRYREPHTVRRWVEQLPQTILAKYPGLCFAHATAILYTSDRGDPHTAVMIEQPLQLAERSWLDAGNRPRLGQLAAFRAMVTYWQGAYADAFAYAQRALELLPTEHSYWRGVASVFTALEVMYMGELLKARQDFLEASRCNEAVHNQRGVRAALICLTELLTLQGEFSQAEQLANQVLAAAVEDRLDQGHALIALARIAYERNELEHIEQNLAPVLETSKQSTSDLGEQHMVEVLVVPTNLLLARVHAARGETVQARACIQFLGAETQISPLVRREVELWQARFALVDGDVATVERWYQTYVHEQDRLFPLHQEQEDLFYARVLMLKEETSTAVRLLEQWRAHAQSHGRTGREIEALLLLALIYATQDDLATAKRTVIEAVALAQPRGYRRLFLDEAAPMATLLGAVYPEVRDGAIRIYLRKLLLDFTHSSPPSAHPPTVLFEPLSRQEERVLRLLSAGLSTPEIAQELVVSINTVKTQVKSIYRKLDVHSREEAREAARHLDLT